MEAGSNSQSRIELPELGAGIFRQIQGGPLITVAKLALPVHIHRRVLAHLLPRRPEAEEAAFIYVRFQNNTFNFIEWYPVPISDFEHRSMYHIELNDDCRAKTIKRAHDLGCSIVEFHSHPLARTAAFSPSDCAGFREYVPHVFWRLKGRPYTAVVVVPSGFDSLAWISDPKTPDGVVDIGVGRKILIPTGATFKTGDHISAANKI